MLKALIISLMTCLCLTGQGQVLNFNTMNAKRMNNYVRSACADNSGNIYIGGDFSKIDTTYYWGIAKWDGIKWDSLGHGMFVSGQNPNGAYGARGLAFYNNEIYAGGGFTSIDGKPIRYIAKWNGTNWDSLPQSPNTPVSDLTVCNGKIYVFGSFNRIGTALCTKMAVWDGTTLSPVVLPFTVYELADVAVYNGEIYIGGIFFNGSWEGCLAKFDGSTWSIVGGGIKGGVVGVNALKVFNNELYIGGWIEKAAGNAGDFLMKWDGTSYKEVIAGLNGQIWNLTEVPDGLIATGCFSTPYNYALKIGNTGVCGYNDVFNNCTQGAVYANNKLYFYGGFTTVNGDSAMGYISNVNYTTQTDSCMAFAIGIKEINSLNNINVSPNPATSTITVFDEENRLQNSNIEIKNFFGQAVYAAPFTTQIDISYLAPGIYFLTIQNVYGSKTVKVIKQ